MKSMARLFTFFIILELILAPMPNLSPRLISEALADDCPSGFQWDNTLNRCLTTEQVASVMNSVSNCNGDKACYKSNAENALKEGEQEGKIKEELANKSGLLGSGMKVAAIAVPLAMVVTSLTKKNKSKPSCGGISMYLMLGGGVAAFAGDTIANSQHNKRLKDIKKEWDGIIASSSNTTSSSNSSASTTTKVSGTEGQSQAFEMLAKSEDSLAQAAKLKSMTYGVATLAFGAATVMSTIDAMNPTKFAEKCKTKEVSDAEAKDGYQGASGNKGTEGQMDPDVKREGYIQDPLHNQTKFFTSLQVSRAKDLATFWTLKQEIDLISESNRSPTLDEYEKNRELFANTGFEKDESLLNLLKTIAHQIYHGISVQDAQADDAAGTVTKAGAAKVVGKVGGFLERPVTRAVLGGILTAWSGIMMMHAMKQAKIAKSRAEYLRQIKDTFNDASSAIGCTDAQRSTPTVPSCYCYTANGSRNPDRSASAVCSTLFNGKSVSATETNYLTTGTTASVVGCITSSGTSDTTCSCKATNSCLAVSSSGITGISTGSISTLNSALTPLNQLGSGTLGSGTIASTGTLNNAIRLLDASNKIAEKSSNGQELIAVKKQATDMANALTNSASGFPSNSLSSGSSLSSLPSNPAAAALALEKELKASPINAVSGGQGAIATPSNSANEPLDFGLAGSEAVNPEAGKIAEVMGQNLDYGQNDINSGSSVNIFEVLSNRYQRSGMRRLFDEEGKTKADKPSLDDIHK